VEEKSELPVRKKNINMNQASNHIETEMEDARKIRGPNGPKRPGGERDVVQKKKTLLGLMGWKQARRKINI